MSARAGIGVLQINFPRDQGTAGELLFRGTPEYLEQARDALTFVVGRIASGYGVSRPNVAMLGLELQDAQGALRKQENFEGLLVSLTMWRH